MPTIIIRTSPLPLARRRAVAVRLTRWLTCEGVPQAGHVVVRFEDIGPGTVFTGGMPVEALPRDPAVPAHASVTCCVSGERDDAFRSRLAAEIAAVLPGGTEMPFLYVEFRSTAPADVWIAQRGIVTRADGKARLPVHPIPGSRHAHETADR
jgi:hypothetical protein